MTAALVGVIGVLAGALLGGVFSSAVERRKRLVAAQAAAQLVVAELEAAEMRISDAIASAVWWTGSLSTRAWERSASDLPPGIRMHVLRRLARAYTSIESINLARTDGTGAPVAELPIAAPGRGGEPWTLANASEEIEKARVELESQLTTPPGAALRIASFGLAVIVAVLIVVALIVQRPDLSNRTVAAAIQTATPTTVGETSTVECTGAGADDWLCKVTQLVPSGRACPASDAKRLPMGASAVTLVGYVPTTRSCENKQYTLDVAEGKNG